MIISRSFSPLLLPVLAFLSLSVRASPHSRTTSTTAALKLAVRVNSNGIKTIAAADRARAQTLVQGGGSSSISASNSEIIYAADIGVGTPPTYYTLLIDTGSSDTWIGASKAYVQTSSSVDTGGQFYIGYGTSLDPNSISGEEYLDTVTLNSDLVIKSQSIGVKESGSGGGLGGGLDGILGLGPVDLTQDTVSNAYEVPTVMNNLHAQGTISSEVLGVFFSPAPDGNTGELTFGGYDASKTTGSVNYVPITLMSPSSAYWGVDQSISYGNTLILRETAGIVDTGSTLILIATDAFHAYQAATGATLDETTGLLMISSDQYNNLSSLYYTIGSITYELIPNAQIWPRSLNTAIGGSSDSIYLVVNDLGSYSGSGLDFINGYCFLQRFYSVFDTPNSRVGFATTAYTYTESN